jgi:hypothetical protein
MQIRQNDPDLDLNSLADNNFVSVNAGEEERVWVWIPKLRHAELMVGMPVVLRSLNVP